MQINNNKKWQDWLDRMDDYEDPRTHPSFDYGLISAVLIGLFIAYLIMR